MPETALKIAIIVGFAVAAVQMLGLGVQERYALATIEIAAGGSTSATFNSDETAPGVGDGSSEESNHEDSQGGTYNGGGEDDAPHGDGQNNMPGDPQGGQSEEEPPFDGGEVIIIEPGNG